MLERAREPATTHGTNSNFMPVTTKEDDDDDDDDNEKKKRKNTRKRKKKNNGKRYDDKHCSAETMDEYSRYSLIKGIRKSHLTIIGTLDAYRSKHRSLFLIDRRLTDGTDA